MTFFLSEIGPEFGETGGTPPRRIPRSTLPGKHDLNHVVPRPYSTASLAVLHGSSTCRAQFINYKYNITVHFKSSRNRFLFLIKSYFIRLSRGLKPSRAVVVCGQIRASLERQ